MSYKTPNSPKRFLRICLTIPKLGTLTWNRNNNFFFGINLQHPIHQLLFFLKHYFCTYYDDDLVIYRNARHYQTFSPLSKLWHGCFFAPLVQKLFGFSILGRGWGHRATGGRCGLFGDCWGCSGFGIGNKMICRRFWSFEMKSLV